MPGADEAVALLLQRAAEVHAGVHQRARPPIHLIHQRLAAKEIDDFAALGWDLVECTKCHFHAVAPLCSLRLKYQYLRDATYRLLACGSMVPSVLFCVWFLRSTSAKTKH